MRAIILSAGKGSRLSAHTFDKPKGMIKFAGKTLLEHQIDVLQSNGVSDIVIIRGYKAHKINFENITYFDNVNFENTNMVESLLCAEDKLNVECLVTYSDLILEDAVINKMVKSEYDIGVLVDENFEDYWKARLGEKYSEDMESLVISDNKIVNLGFPNPKLIQVDGRYVGAIKFSAKGIKELLRICKINRKKDSLNSFGSRNFKNWHMTDLLQCIIDTDLLVNPIIISKGWLEFDTDKDYDLYTEWYLKKTLNRFINLGLS